MPKTKIYLVVVTVFLGMLTFLLTSYMGNFVERPEYLRDKSKTDLNIGVLQNDMQYLKAGQGEMKEQLKRIEGKLR